MARLWQKPATAEDKEPWPRALQCASSTGITWQQNASGEWVKFENDVVRAPEGYTVNQTQLDYEWRLRSKTAHGETGRRKLPSLSVRTDLEGLIGLADMPRRGRHGGSPGRNGGSSIPAEAGMERKRRGATSATSSSCRSSSRGSGSPMRSDDLSSNGSSIPSQKGRMSSKGGSADSERQGSSASSARTGSKGIATPGKRTSSPFNMAGVEHMGSREIMLDRQLDRMHPNGTPNDDGPRSKEYVSMAGSRNTTPRAQLQVPAGRRRSCPLRTVEPAGQVVIEAPKSTPRVSQFRRKMAPVADLDEPDYESRPSSRASVTFAASTGSPVHLKKQEYCQPTPSTASSTPAAPKKFEEPEELTPVVSPVRQDGRLTSVRLLLKNSEEVQPALEGGAHESQRSHSFRGKSPLRPILCISPPLSPTPPESSWSPKEERLKQLRELHEDASVLMSESSDFATQ